MRKSCISLRARLVLKQRDIDKSSPSSNRSALPVGPPDEKEGDEDGKTVNQYRSCVPTSATGSVMCATDSVPRLPRYLPPPSEMPRRLHPPKPSPPRDGDSLKSCRKRVNQAIGAKDELRGVDVHYTLAGSIARCPCHDKSPV